MCICFFSVFSPWLKWLPVRVTWLPCCNLCLCKWSPGWSPVPVYHSWEIFAHTTKVSHHICTLFLACPLPWTGHLVVRQEQARSPHWVFIHVCLFVKIKVSNALQTCISWLYFRPGWFFLHRGSVPLDFFR